MIAPETEGPAGAAPFVLASASPRRLDLLRQAGIAPDAPYTLVASERFDLSAVDRPVDIAFANSLFSHLTLNSIVTCLLLFSGVQLISLGILGEYVGRIFEEVKARPLYVVKADVGRGLRARSP